MLTPKGQRQRTICNLGKLDPGPKEDWILLAERIQAALGGQAALFPDPRVEDAVRRVRARQAKLGPATVEEAPPRKADVPDVVPVQTRRVNYQDLRKVGPLLVGHQMWQRLQVDVVLKAVGLSEPARQLTELMALNRLVHPCSELAMVEWAKREAVADVLGVETERLSEDRFYRNMDQLHGHRLEIERELYAREKSLFKDLDTLVQAVAKDRDQGEPMTDRDLGVRIGRLRERYPRAARYYEVERQQDGALAWTVKAELKARAVDLDGAYFLRTSRKDLGPEDIWRTYIALTQIESAFRDLKGTLDMRPIYHQKEIRVETHIFLAVLAYHLQVGIERTLKDAGDHTSWKVLREQLGTHQVVTTLLPAADGRTLAIRRGSVPDRRAGEIYRLLKLDPEPMEPIRTWL